MKMKVISDSQKKSYLYIFLFLFFGFCRFMHNVAFVKVEKVTNYGYHFRVVNDKTDKVIALVNLMESNEWWMFAYMASVFATVIWMQLRGHSATAYWLVSAIFSIPFILYIMIVGNIGTVI